MDGVVSEDMSPKTQPTLTLHDMTACMTEFWMRSRTHRLLAQDLRYEYGIRRTVPYSRSKSKLGKQHTSSRSRGRGRGWSRR
jgi:hypothetical protein